MSGQVVEQYRVDPRQLMAVVEAVNQIAGKAEKNGLGRIEFTRAGHVGEVPLVEISTPTPAIGSFELIAKISHMKGGRAFVSPIAGERLDFDQVRAEYSDPRCDHCGVNRPRKTTFLLSSPSRGEAQVGSSCLKEYVGESDPRKALVQADLFAQARELVKAAAPAVEREGAGRLPTVDEFLANVAAVIRTEGHFTRKKDGEADETPTADLAFENFRQLAVGVGDPIEVTEADRDLAMTFKADFLDRTANENELAGFDLRLRHCLAKDVAWPDIQGIVATVFPRVTAIRKQDRRGPGNWLGEVGTQVAALVDLRKVGNPRQTRFGPQYPHFFLTVDGDWVTWWATNIQLQVGDRYELTGDVKKREERKGHRVTVLANCRAEDLS